MAVAGLRAVYQWVLRTMMKSKGETGIVQALPNKDLIELNTQVTAQRLMQNGIDPTTLKNPDQVENVIKMIESKPTTGGVTSAKSAKVFDMEGKEIPKGSKIMGGKAIDDDLPPPGSRGGKDDIAAPIQSADESLRDMTEAEIKKKLEKANKKGIANIKARQKMIDEAIDNVSPGFSGDLRVDADLVAEEMATRMGKVYDDLPDLEGTRLYGEAYDALSKKRFESKLDPEDFAQGGRAGFKNGLSPAMQKRMMELLMQGVPMDKVQKEAESQLRQEEFRSKAGPLLEAAQGGRVGLKKGMDRRTFMKIMGGLATLPILGKFIKPITKTAPVVKEAVTKAPDYFFALVDKIKRFGKSVDDPVADPRVERTYRYKNYELRENAFGDPGETIVTKTDDMGEFGYKEESMRFKKGGPTEDGVVPDEYEEMTIRPDAEGKLKDVEDGIEDVSEIIEEVSKGAPPIKKASGGIARMLGE